MASSELFDMYSPLLIGFPLRIEAKLRYLAYPSSFASLMDLAAPAPVDVAKTSLELTAP